MAKGKKKKKSGKRFPYHKYEMYQRAVQEPEPDIDFINEIYKRHFRRAPRALREDFCGAAYLACEWVAHHGRNRAWGVDLDPEPLEWGIQRNAAQLGDEARDRLTLIEGDVMNVRHDPVDVVVGFNFSYFVLHTRELLLRYFEAARANLGDRGLFLLDIYGGPEAQSRVEESTEYERFSYVWDQDQFDAINNRMVCHIHFDTPGGRRMKRAFSYDWRLWSIAEVREVLAEAGFAAAEVYWEGVDEKTGEGDGVFTRAESEENTDSWIAYVIGVKK